MPRRELTSQIWGYARGTAPLSNDTLTEGHSRFRTSGGAAVAMIDLFLEAGMRVIKVSCAFIDLISDF